MKKSTRISLDLSDEQNKILEQIAEELNTSKSNALRKAIYLLEAATSIDENEHLGVTDHKDKLKREFILICSRGIDALHNKRKQRSKNKDHSCQR